MNIWSYSSLRSLVLGGSLKKMKPLLTKPFGGSSCVMAYAAVVFPQPLSPTRPIVSPASIMKLTPSTALTQPFWILKCTFRS